MMVARKIESARRGRSLGSGVSLWYILGGRAGGRMARSRRASAWRRSPTSPGDCRRMPQRRPVVLIVLDGWGYREAREGNAIALANTPTWDRLWSRAPRTLLEASGLAVGL